MSTSSQTRKGENRSCTPTRPWTCATYASCSSGPSPVPSGIDASRRQNRSGFHQHQSEWVERMMPIIIFMHAIATASPCGMEQLTATEANKLIVRQRSRHGQPQKDKWAGTGGTRPCGGRLREVVWPYSLARPAGYRGSKGYIECGWRRRIGSSALPAGTHAVHLSLPSTRSGLASAQG